MKPVYLKKEIHISEENDTVKKWTNIALESVNMNDKNILLSIKKYKTKYRVKVVVCLKPCIFGEVKVVDDIDSLDDAIHIRAGFLYKISKYIDIISL